jgi:hypothetical protein
VGYNKKICNKNRDKHVHAWNWDRKEGSNLCYKPSQQNQAHEHQCREVEKICEDM